MAKRILTRLAPAFGLLPGVALAAPASDVAVPEGSIRVIGDVYATICHASNWFFAIVVLIAVFALLYGAIKFFTAGGNEDQSTIGRKYVTLSIVGIIVAVLAKSIVYVVGNFVTDLPGTGFFACP